MAESSKLPNDASEELERRRAEAEEALQKLNDLAADERGKVIEEGAAAHSYVDYPYLPPAKDN